MPGFIASGVRWWDGMHYGGHRTCAQGVFSLRND